MATVTPSPSSGMSFGVNTITNGINNGVSGVKSAANNNWFIFWIVVFFHFLNVGLDLTFIGVPFNFPGMQWFNGLNIAYLWKTPGLAANVLYTNTITNVTFWVIMAFVFVFGRGKSWEEFCSKVLMIIAFIAVSVFSGIYNFGDFAALNVLGIVIEIILIIVIRNAILKNQYNIVEANYYTILIIFLDFYLINIIQFIFPAQLDIVNRFVFPILVLTVIIYMESSTLKSWLIFGILVMYLIFFMTSSPNIRANFAAGFKGAEKDASTKVAQTFSEKWKTFWTGTMQSWNESKRMIGTDYYSGQVEQNQEKPLGVFLEDMKGDTDFLTEETITVWKKIKVQSLQNNNLPDNESIKISVICYLKNGSTNIIPGELSPKKEFSVAAYEEEFLTCTFKDLNLSAGPYKVFFNASFNFETQSYLKVYYIDKDRKRTFMANNVDILNEYGISDTNPSAIYTNGPIKIGMETTTPLPIGVSSKGSEFNSYIGITIDKHWMEGNLKNISYLWIILPEGLEFGDGCDSFENLPNKLWDTETGEDGYIMVSKYRLKENKTSTDNKKGFSLPKSYKCALKLVNDNSEKLLGQTPVSLRYFKARIGYVYEITKSSDVNIRSKTA